MKNVHKSICSARFFLVLCFAIYINDLPDDVIYNIAICFDDTTIYSKCDLASDLLQQLQLASELESDLGDKMDWVLCKLGHCLFKTICSKVTCFALFFCRSYRWFFLPFEF